MISGRGRGRGLCEGGTTRLLLSVFSKGRRLESISVGADLYAPDVGAARAAQTARHRIVGPFSGPGDQQRQPHSVRRVADDLAAEFGNGFGVTTAPAVDSDRFEHDIARSAVGQR